MSKSFRYYKVIETKDTSAEELQRFLDKATDALPEMQIDHVVGTKIILGYESMLNEKGRMQSKVSSVMRGATT